MYVCEPLVWASLVVTLVGSVPHVSPIVPAMLLSAHEAPRRYYDSAY